MPYPDFVNNNIINPDEFDSNSLAITTKFNELISTTNTHIDGSGGVAHALATTGAPGFMDATDKAKLNSVETGANNYVHPATHAPSIILQDSSNRFVTDAEKTSWNAKLNASGGTISGSLVVTGTASFNSNVTITGSSTLNTPTVTLGTNGMVRGSVNNLVLSGNGGTIYFRPNGDVSSVGEFRLTSAGSMVTDVAQTGSCGLGAVQTITNGTQILAGVWVPFQTKRGTAPTGITLSGGQGSAVPTATADIRTDGFWLYINAPATSVVGTFYYWRGTYTTTG